MVTVRSFAKINLGLCIGPPRPDGFHDLLTVYQTIALHDVIRVQLGAGSGIEIRCDDPRVPRDQTKPCYRIVERAMAALAARGRVTITIDKRLPVQGGLGAGSGNAVAALLALERALKKHLPAAERLRIAAQVGSDLPCSWWAGRSWGWDTGKRSIPCRICRPSAAWWRRPKLGYRPPRRLRTGMR
jgi:4-diphosphocytidyl-2-C-methyl-D-erythritol kinase